MDLVRSAATLLAYSREDGAPLPQADVNVRMVMNLRANVKKRVNITEVAAGLNARRIIEKAVYDELCAMLDGWVSGALLDLTLTPLHGRPGCSIQWHCDHGSSAHVAVMLVVRIMFNFARRTVRAASFPLTPHCCTGGEGNVLWRIRACWDRTLQPLAQAGFRLCHRGAAKPKDKEKDKKGGSGGGASGLKKGKPNVVMFVGLQGSGKTTTCTKCALSSP